VDVTLTVNGRRRTVSAAPDTPLLWVLREHLALPGTKYGCGNGICGACTVLVDGEARHSCTVPLSSAADRRVTTIEGIAQDRPHPVQRAWIEEDVSQCGYCQPGQIMTAVALLARHPNPTDAQIDAAMTNLCTCGTFQRIRAAIHRAAGGGAT